MSQKKDALQNSLDQLAEAAAILKLEPHVHELLRYPMREYTIRIPLQMDDGTTRIVEGYRFHHNWALGPMRGGLRFHKDETANDVRALALWMTIKTACNNIPNGGCKGGVVIDPESLSKRELERLCRAYVRATSRILGTMVDFPGADIGTGIETQNWMLDEWESIHQRNEPSAVMGKAELLGGSAGRLLSTSMGALFATREVLKTLNLKAAGLRVVIQGFGKVGYNLAPLYAAEGMKVCGISDVNGGIYNPDGLNVSAVQAHYNATGSLAGFPGAQAVSNKDLLELECDILAPCAVQNVITEDNAEQIRARIVMEVANGPVTLGGEKILLKKGVFICPDVFTNVGAVQVGQLERTQNLMHDKWNEDYIFTKVEGIFKEVYKELYETSQRLNITMRMACWTKAVARVVDAMKMRGWV